jgi:hypothetical protein
MIRGWPPSPIELHLDNAQRWGDDPVREWHVVGIGADGQEAGALAEVADVDLEGRAGFVREGFVF